MKAELRRYLFTVPGQRGKEYEFRILPAPRLEGQVRAKGPLEPLMPRAAAR